MCMKHGDKPAKMPTMCLVHSEIGELEPTADVLTHTEIWESFSLKPPKIWRFISEKSEIIPKHFENLTYKSLNFLNILIWTPLY